MAKHPKTVAASPEVLGKARAQLEQLGALKAAEALGISRSALLGLCATGRAMAGTLALMQLKREAAKGAA